MIERIRKRFADNPKLLEELKSALFDDEVVDFVLPNKFQIWKTIKLGTGLKIADDFRKALNQSGNNIASWANGVLEETMLAVRETEIEVDLYNLTTTELTGKEEFGTIAEVFAGAKRLGFEKCSPQRSANGRMAFYRLRFPSLLLPLPISLGVRPSAQKSLVNFTNFPPWFKPRGFFIQPKIKITLLSRVIAMWYDRLHGNK